MMFEGVPELDRERVRRLGLSEEQLGAREVKCGNSVAVRALGVTGETKLSMRFCLQRNMRRRAILCHGDELWCGGCAR